MVQAPGGALADLRVVELANERCAFAGKLLADMGAEVVLVEPPDGDPTRGYPPFLDDEPGRERSLFFWHHNTSKLGVTLDLSTDEDRARLRRLVATADLVIEAEDPGRLAALELDFSTLGRDREDLIWVSITPFGSEGPRRAELATDLTVLAGGGPAWNNGYDDHSLPPVRGGGQQGYYTGCHFAVMSALVALVVRDQTGRGQHVDVSLHAAANVTTEAGSYNWLIAQQTVQRQTGRHAGPQPSRPSQVLCGDGRYVNITIPPRTPREFAAVAGWLEEEGLADEFPQAEVLARAASADGHDLASLGSQEEIRAIYAAARDAQIFLATRLSAYDFFIGSQRRGVAVGIVYSPEEAIDDPQSQARGFRVPVEHPELGRSFDYPGAPYAFRETPWRIRRRAPLLGEHNEQTLGALE